MQQINVQYIFVSILSYFLYCSRLLDIKLVYCFSFAFSVSDSFCSSFPIRFDADDKLQFPHLWNPRPTKL
ncbi:hypothetical protein RJT34_28580 [Clitoria ternatea]|uniref:Uncharacterized protein n=1 Tax=Clitoria ternatea TaxID=43366 RepID=A0AAN9IAD4_CLITE